MRRAVAKLLAVALLAGASGLSHALDLNGVTQISAGFAHACAVTQAGAVYCWGLNSSGQLGDGSTHSRPLAIPVTGLASSVVAVSAGGSHTCALTSSGGVKCWGANGSGQLGNGTTISSAVPVDVTGLTSGVVAISAGGTHTCAVTDAGGVKCWGSNGEGELGNGSQTSQSTPVDVTGLSGGIVDVAAAHLHTCALTSGGGVKCWGANESGQLGDGTMERRVNAVDVMDLGSGVAQISVARASGEPFYICCPLFPLTLRTGGTSCAVMSNGAAKCWGAGHSGQLGNGITTASTVPVDVTNLGAGTTAAISVGPWVYCAIGRLTTDYYSHTCSVTTAGGLKCWGHNTYGELGLPTTESCGWTTGFQPMPIDVAALPVNQIAIASGSAYTCSLANDTKVRCWGLNNLGQLGAGEITAPRPNPLPVVQPDANSPDLSVSQVRTPVPASAGKDIVFIYTVVNNGASTDSNVNLRNEIPPGSSFIWTTPNCSHSGAYVLCSFGSLASGAGVQAKAVFRPASAGSITNTVSVSGSAWESSYANNLSTTTTTVDSTPPGVPALRYRLYSDVSKEHHFTTDLNEYNTLGTMGWQQEGTVGHLLDNPASYNGVAAVPYYRLYDQRSLWHHWTSDPNEYYTLAEFPWWSGEGVDGWILPTQGPGTIMLHRLLYPFIPGLHHWTIDAYEYSVLTTQYGWIDEGGSGFVIP